VVRVLWIDESGEVVIGGLDALPVANAWTWIDVIDPDQQTLEDLASPLGLHPLVIEDSLKPQARPKFDIYPEGPFLVWLAQRLDDDGSILSEELDCHLGARHLVTIHRGRIEALERVVADAGHAMKRGPDWVLHSILDRMADSLMPVVSHIGDRIEHIEDRMLDEPERDDMASLHRLRRELLFIHRTITPLRDVIRALARERDYVSEEVYRYFDDVVDHLSAVEQALDTYREITSAVTDIYLSAQSNKLNEVMKVLTVATVILGAGTLIAGIYGMNLLPGMWPPYDSSWGFATAIGLMVVAGALMSLYFRRKNWW
jgi:magnesium transporter